MLNTKPVKYLQSLPYHTRFSIFIFVMAILGITVFSFWAYSLSNTFLAEKNGESNSATQETLSIGKEKLPSLLSSMKADISEFGITASQFYSNYIRSGENQKSSLDINQIKKINPVKLPINKQ